MTIDLISFVKLIPEYQNVYIQCGGRTEQLTLRLFAEHANDIICGVERYAENALCLKLAKGQTIAANVLGIGPCG